MTIRLSTIIFYMVVLSNRISSVSVCEVLPPSSLTACPKQGFSDNIESCNKQADFTSEYFFPTEPVLKLDCEKDDFMDWLKRKQPVILKNCEFFNNALKWDVAYLSKELIDDYPTSVSKTRNFLYYNSRRDLKSFSVDNNWVPPYETRYSSFKDFLNIASELRHAKNGSHAYFQTLLLNEDPQSSVKDDLNTFDYSWLLQIAFRLGWSTNIINMLFVGMPNVVTQAHYDMLENIFIQLQGKKRFILFSPDHFSNLYPYPVGHPHDRHSQINFDNPDFHKFPKFRNVHAREAIIEPGDVLYLPSSWWHHVESNQNNFTVSLNFWFEDNHIVDRIMTVVEKSATTDKPTVLDPVEMLAFRRYVETIVYNVTRDINEVKKLFQDLLLHRFPDQTKY